MLRVLANFLIYFKVILVGLLDALEINEVILLRLQGDNHEYLSTTAILNRDDELVADIDDYPIEEAFLSTPQ
ncbi:hypothetical protein BpHYR1_029733, partial [Brachionus plicatilis]